MSRSLPKALRGRKCGATCAHREGDPPEYRRKCNNAAGFKTIHPGYGQCKFHGGNTPNGIKHAETLRAKDATVAFGLPIQVTPQDALLQEVHRTAGAVAYLQEIVGGLSQSELKQNTYDNQGKQWEKAAVWVEMYEGERAHLVRVAAEAIKCGVAERAVALAEAQGQLLAGAIKAILTELDVINDPRAPEVVGRALRAIAPPAVIDV